MKSVFCVVIVFAAFITLSYAAVGYGYFNDPANPGKCTIKNLILSPGEEAKDPEGECVRIVCGNEGLAQIQSCSAQSYKKGCVGGDYKDKSLPYPECCERKVICSKLQ